jgi:hypothetical protein
MKAVSTNAKKRKKKLVIAGIALGVAGIAGYFTWQYIKKKKSSKTGGGDALLKTLTTDIEKTTNTVVKPAKPKVKPTTPVRFASQVMLMSFPLKQGSRGEKVRQLQEALIQKHGAGILPKHGADGDFGTETVKALQRLALPTTITESIFNVIVGDTKTESTFLGKELFAATQKKDFAKALSVLKKMKNTEDYTAANEYFKQRRINGGVRQTIVNGLLKVFNGAAQKEKIKFEFLRMGLQFDGSKWSLSGLDGFPLITKEPTMIWVSATKGVNVPARMVLGNEVSRRLDYTLFENKGKYFLVRSASVTYLN